MSQTAYLDYLQSLHWCNLRELAFLRDGQRCRCCGRKNKLRGHHMRYRTPMESCVDGDILTLCETCHDSLHRGLKFKRIYLSCIATPEQSVAFIVGLKTDIAYQEKYFRKKPQQKRRWFNSKAKKKSKMARAWKARMKRFQAVQQSIKRFQSATKVTRETNSNFGTNRDGRLIYSPH